QKALKEELEWVRQNAKGRQAKSKARLAKFDELSSQEFQNRNETQELYIPPGERLGNNVIKLKDLVKSFDDKILIDGLDMDVYPGSSV
ncbi:energy-dependent translational throttle protein EttA, partial [Francisella tularensis subsp. holarctica]|nr:energy-dependent translational throttle protein EttA [Francisella tularensis subsp. holarctica]